MHTIRKLKYSQCVSQTPTTSSDVIRKKLDHICLPSPYLVFFSVKELFTESCKHFELGPFIDSSQAIFKMVVSARFFNLPKTSRILH